MAPLGSLVKAEPKETVCVMVIILWTLLEKYGQVIVLQLWDENDHSTTIQL